MRHSMTRNRPAVALFVFVVLLFLVGFGPRSATGAGAAPSAPAAVVTVAAPTTGTTIPGTTIPGTTIPGTTITVPPPTTATTTITPIKLFFLILQLLLKIFFGITLPPIPPTTIPPTTIPPTTVPPTTVPPTTSPGPKNCGTVYYASGWPTTMVPSPTFFTCVLDAFNAGTPATLVTREQTDGLGGHILITTYTITGPTTVKVTVDATGAQPPGGVTTSVCHGLELQNVHLVHSSCTTAP